MGKEEIVLVDENDSEIGTEEKIKAHQGGGRLHRAFSIFIFNSRGEMLLQRRAGGKYHCGGLWTNACCSHPRPGEPTEDAARRRLMQEMGFDTKLREIFSFIYRASFENGLTEHELDHVFVGTFNGQPEPNPQEADGFRWVAAEELERDVRKNPEKYTPWFRISVSKVIEWLKKNKNKI